MYVKTQCILQAGQCSFANSAHSRSYFIALSCPVAWKADSSDSKSSAERIFKLEKTLEISDQSLIIRQICSMGRYRDLIIRRFTRIIIRHQSIFRVGSNVGQWRTHWRTRDDVG
ncbi:hypothetical protein CY34DRAFT_451041 [Suillus luteus UH-Slu-Lm8-n1]|uniref:Uncharacterized protein n=1 Tax=Suillus luteus UH-Slu-Lm8-n1 TaxID=930992 RepID=A0A0D0AWX7_9AGAM|nr:hypothetical protein CY34DRAFT_451041 [Suillus luteus UH-Slu-Lm8-n1]